MDERDRNVPADAAAAQAALPEDDQMLLMALADGALDDDPALRARAEAIAVAHPALAGAAVGQRAMAQALQQAVWEPPALTARQLDALALVEGRVVRSLSLTPAEQAHLRAAAASAEAARTAPRPAGLWAAIGWTRLVFGLGAVATAVVVVLALRPPQLGPDGGGASPISAAVPAAPSLEADDAPAVIIEEMEQDQGTIVVDPAQDGDAPVILWHMGAEGGEG